MNMKIERSTLDQVKARFAANKKKMAEKKQNYDLEQRVKELKEEVRDNFYFWVMKFNLMLFLN